VAVAVRRGKARGHDAAESDHQAYQCPRPSGDFGADGRILTYESSRAAAAQLDRG
jgi:hypothetical protein